MRGPSEPRQVCLYMSVRLSIYPNHEVFARRKKCLHVIFFCSIRGDLSSCFSKFCFFEDLLEYCFQNIYRHAVANELAANAVAHPFRKLEAIWEPLQS